MEAWCRIDFEHYNPFNNGTDLYLNNELVSDLVIPEGTASIYNHAFDGFGNITSVTIPASVKSIGEGAFSSCSNLQTITFEGITEQWYEVALGENWKDGVPAKQIICSDGTANL